MKILYLLGEFPKVTSEAFLLNEIIELKKMGHDVWVHADFTPPLNDDQIHGLIHEHGFMNNTLISDNNGLPKRIRSLFRFVTCLIADAMKAPLLTAKMLYYTAIYRKGFFSISAYPLKIDNYLIAREIAGMGFDIIHSPFGGIDKMERGLALSRICDVPFTIAFRALELYDARSRERIRKERKTYEKADIIMTISEQNRAELAGLLDNGSPIRIVHSSIDPGRFRPSRRHGKGCRIITIARFVEKKGIPYLLEALRMLKDRGLGFKYLLIGEGPLSAQYRRQIARLGLQDAVTIERPVRQELIRKELSESTMLVLPCVIARNGDRDILPNVLKEAMAMELPVITSDISGIRELVEDGKNGLLVKDRDPAGLADAIRTLLDDEELRHSLGACGRRRIIEDFNVHTQAAKLAEVFTDAIRARRVSSSGLVYTARKTMRGAIADDAMMGKREWRALWDERRKA